MEAARAFGNECAKQGIQIVYGGGTTGLMGEVAKTVVRQTKDRNSVLGIIPKPLLEYEAKDGPKIEVSQTSQNPDTEGTPILPDPEVFGELVQVDTMLERKELMAKKVSQGGPGSGFVALPGGYGTLDEVLEMTTWNQLNILDVPMILFNVGGFWDYLLKQVQVCVEGGFVKPENAPILGSGNDTESVMKALREYQPSEGRYKMKWHTAMGWSSTGEVKKTPDTS